MSDIFLRLTAVWRARGGSWEEEQQREGAEGQGGRQPGSGGQEGGQGGQARARKLPTLRDVAGIAARAEQRGVMVGWMRDELRAMASRQGISLSRDPSKRDLIEELLVRATRRSLPPSPRPVQQMVCMGGLPATLMHASRHMPVVA